MDLQDALCRMMRGVVAMRGRRMGDLRFTSEREAEFDAATAALRVTNTRHYLIFFLVADLLALVLDANHGSLRHGLWLRLGLVAPSLVLGIVLLTPRRPVWQQGLLAALPVLLGLCSIMLIGLLMGGRFPELYLTAAGMGAFFVNAAFPLRFRHAAALTAAFSLATILLVFTCHGANDPSGLIGTLLFNISVSVVTLRLNHRSEQHRRLTFVYELQLRSQADALLKTNMELTRLSNTDPLTNISNRRLLQSALEAACAQARLSRDGFGLLLIDIDHFKLYNDTLGHAAGDVCLRMVADTIRSEVRHDTDTVARYGGEEFAVLMPASTLHQAGATGDHIIRALAERAIPHPGLGTRQRLTVSIGAAIARESENWSSEQALRRADTALYRAKEHGRDCIILDDPVDARERHDRTASAGLIRRSGDRQLPGGRLVEIVQQSNGA